MVDVSRAADQPSFDELPWLQPFPDRFLEDALLATYAAAVPFLEIPRACHCLDSHGATVTTCAVLLRLTPQPAPRTQPHVTGPAPGQRPACSPGPSKMLTAQPVQPGVSAQRARTARGVIACRIERGTERPLSICRILEQHRHWSSIRRESKLRRYREAPAHTHGIRCPLAARA